MGEPELHMLSLILEENRSIQSLHTGKAKLPVAALLGGSDAHMDLSYQGLNDSLTGIVLHLARSNQMLRSLDLTGNGIQVEGLRTRLHKVCGHRELKLYLDGGVEIDASRFACVSETLHTFGPSAASWLQTFIIFVGLPSLMLWVRQLDATIFDWLPEKPLLERWRTGRPEWMFYGMLGRGYWDIPQYTTVCRCRIEPVLSTRLSLTTGLIALAEHIPLVPRHTRHFQRRRIRNLRLRGAANHCPFPSSLQGAE